MTFLLVLVDINECDSAGSCSQTCINTDGSYTCGCYSGCELANDGFNCSGRKLLSFETEYIHKSVVDVNECDQGTSSCTQICTNTYCSADGDGYECSCESGYDLADDGYSCDGKTFEGIVSHVNI